jgi:hypothetical protein
VVYRTVETEGLIRNRVEADGLTDPELIVSAFYRWSETQPFAVLVNFSAHPTTLGAWNMYLSADYPGVVTREVEQCFPATTCLFFAGAVGDQAPVKSGEAFERAEWIGVRLARQVAALLGEVNPESPEVVSITQEQMRLPPAELRIGRFTFPRWLGRRLVDDDASLSVLSVGAQVFVAVPCDLTASLGATLKQSARARGFNPMIIGFANDYIGYCVPAALYEAKQYESSMAFNGPKAGELVVSRLVQMLDRVARAGEPSARPDDVAPPVQ